MLDLQAMSEEEVIMTLGGDQEPDEKENDEPEEQEDKPKGPPRPGETN